MSGFALQEELLRLQQGEVTADQSLDSDNPRELAKQLDRLGKTLTDSPTELCEDASFHQLTAFLAEYSQLTPKLATQLVDTLLVPFQQELDLIKEEMMLERFYAGKHTEVLERFAYLFQWLTNDIVGRVTAKSGLARTGKGARGSKDHAETGLPSNWNRQSEALWKCFYDCLSLKLNQLWDSTPARDTFIGVLTKMSYQLLEHRPFVKQGDLKKHIFRCLGYCVQHYNHTFAAKTTILQYLQHYDHLSDTMAEFLVACYEQYDAVQLVDEVLRDVAHKDFKNADAKEGPKSFGQFLVYLSELSPKAIMKQMGLLVRLLDCEQNVVRGSLIEVIGNLIVYLADLGDDNLQRRQIAEYFEILEQRFRDNYFNCRSKVLQVCIKLCEAKAKFPKQRPRLIDLVVSRLQDKTSMVRRNAIKALTAFLQSHPFCLDGGLLMLDEFTVKNQEIEAQLKEITERYDASQLVMEVKADEPEPTTPSKGQQATTSLVDSDDEVAEGDDDQDSVPVKNEAGKNSDAEFMEDDSDHVNTGEEANTPTPSTPAAQLDEATVAQFMQLQLQQRYYRDALRFAYQLDDAIPILCQHLASTNKGEVMEAMDFFVVAYHYKIERANEGIRKMLHLVWTKDNASDEAKGVKTKLLDCYHKLYLMPRPDMSVNDNINQTVRNLIGLTYQATLADLTSLEELLSCMMNEGHIPEGVVDKLWSVYSYTRDDLAPEQRRGAIVILGMLAKADRTMVTDNIDALLKVGLGRLGRHDLVLAKYTCIALQCLGAAKKRTKAVQLGEPCHLRFPRDNPIVIQLCGIMEDTDPSPEWFPLAEQAVNTIYALSEQPDVTCTELIRRFTQRILQVSDQSAPRSDSPQPESTVAMDEDDEGNAAVPEMTEPPPTQSTTQRGEPCMASSFPLCQVIFLVGHVAIKQIILLEVIEAELKRRKGLDRQKKTPSKDNAKAGEDDELDQVTGTTEDDVADTIHHIRERELLYGPKSLLAVYGHMIVHVCSHAKHYRDPMLLTQATLALAKLMCISAEFCEKHLPLLLNFLAHAETPIIRSNVIIALGDIAVCFNNLIGENVGYLYAPLHDRSKAVKKNALMVLTHLVLNGMIKVKGQLGEMAKCLEDPDRRISDLAKLFFTELASKDNYVYNNLPDMISTLSTGPHAVTEEAFGRIMKFLFDFIKDKERQTENIADKLCQRFRNTDDPRQWRDIAYCLALIPYRSERSFKKLVDHFQYYHDKLTEEAVYKSLCDIITKTRIHSAQRMELKHLVEEYEIKVREARTRCTGEADEGQADVSMLDESVEMPSEELVSQASGGPTTSAPLLPTAATGTPVKKPGKRVPTTPGTALKAKTATGQKSSRCVAKVSSRKVRRTGPVLSSEEDDSEAEQLMSDLSDDDGADSDGDPFGSSGGSHAKTPSHRRGLTIRTGSTRRSSRLASAKSQRHSNQPMISESDSDAMDEDD
ncbi:condensin complex non-SMC subunit Cnd1 [Dispira parvispora]|uniref:Condensin complex subunit 1 n=1 Tax=Dispira parvispora TaxID=1520584 RepID=A0A9W8E526_9FUNG|nr:condensin complex non-SMC subunit Cnd1 [Dispira parvispora]